MTQPSTFEAVVAEMARGATSGVAARRLGLSAGLTDAVVDEAERLGLLGRYGGACSSCAAPSVKGCVGCPMSSIRREA